MKPYLVILILLFACNTRKTSDSNQDKFDLKSDLINFSNKMNEGDTITININWSMCMTYHLEKDEFTKMSDSIFITTNIKSDLIKSGSKTLNQTQYKYQIEDTLNFENFFKYLISKKNHNFRESSKIVQAIYKTDTLIFYSEGLGDRIRILEYYNRIKNKVFPDEKLYQPVPPPSPIDFIK